MIFIRTWIAVSLGFVLAEIVVFQLGSAESLDFYRAFHASFGAAMGLWLYRKNGLNK